MKEIRLKNLDYIMIPTDTCASYGGNQTWHSKKRKLGRETRLNRFGCGTIALADLWLYLAQRQDKTALTAPVFQADGMISKTAYMNYIRKINRTYTFTIPYFGISAPTIVLAFNRYARKYNLPLRAHYRYFLNNRKILDLIIKMLQQDFPVILLIGPNFPKFWGKNGISFYTLEQNSYIPTCNTQVHSHYVTVTGVKIPSSGAPMLQIASWGQRFYINYWEYRKYITHYGNRLTSGLIELKAPPSD